MTETQQIVEWLRELADRPLSRMPFKVSRWVLRRIATAIERGEWRK